MKKRFPSHSLWGGALAVGLLLYWYPVDDFVDRFHDPVPSEAPPIQQAPWSQQTPSSTPGPVPILLHKSVPPSNPKNTVSIHFYETSTTTHIGEGALSQPVSVPIVLGGGSAPTTQKPQETTPPETLPSLQPEKSASSTESQPARRVTRHGISFVVVDTPELQDIMLCTPYATSTY